MYNLISCNPTCHHIYLIVSHCVINETLSELLLHRAITRTRLQSAVYKYKNVTISMLLSSSFIWKPLTSTRPVAELTGPWHNEQAIEM